MAQIPQYVARAQPLETGGVVRYPQDSPVGRALEGFGNTLTSVGAHLQRQQDARAEHLRAMQEKLDAFQENRASALLPEMLAGDLQAAEQSATGPGVGLHDSLLGEFDPVSGAVSKPGLFDERVKAVRESIPESMRWKFDARLPKIRQQFSNQAARVETEQRYRYYDSEIKDGLQKLSNGVLKLDNDPANFELFLKQGEELINSSGLPEQNEHFGNSIIHGKTDRLREWREQAAEALFKSRDPAEQKRIADSWFAAPEQTGQAGPVSASLTDRIIQVESGGNPNAKASTSSATGLGQFTKGTWKAFLAERHPEYLGSGLDLRRDPDLSREAVEWYADKNQATLRDKGLPVTAGTTYLAHFLGPQGAVDMLSASPMRTAASVNPDAAKANRSIFYYKDGQAKSVAKVLAWAERKMGNAEPSVAAAEAGPSNDNAPQEDPRFRYLPADRRIVLARSAHTAAEAASASEKVTVSGLVSDDIASMGKTGEGVAELTPERVASALGEEKALKWQQERQAAQSRFQATDGMEAEPNAALTERLNALRPTPGAPGYDAALDAYEAAEKRASAIQKQRATDPAESVSALPEVRSAVQAFNDATPTERDALFKQVIRSRLAAQDRVGIPPVLQLPLTDSEADTFAAPIKNAAQLGAGGPEESWFEIVEQTADAFKVSFGEYSDEAFRQVVGKLIGGDDDKAIYATKILNAMLKEQAAPVSDARAVDDLSETKRVEDAAKQFSGAPTATGPTPGLVPRGGGAPAPRAPAQNYSRARSPSPTPGVVARGGGGPANRKPVQSYPAVPARDMAGMRDMIRPKVTLPKPEEDDIDFLREHPETIWDFMAVFGDAEIPADIPRVRR